MAKTKIATILWLLLAIFACLSAYNSASQGNELVETIKMALLMVGGLGVIITMVYQAESLIENSKQLSNKIEFDKFENSFQLLKDWDNPSLLEARKYTREVKKKRDCISDKELLKEIEETKDLEHSVVTTFNFWEQVFLSIEYNRVDESILRKAFDKMYCGMYKRFEVWIKENASKDMQASLKSLHEKWES